MTYTELVAILAGLLVPSTLATDPDFLVELPEAISYANNRICRRIDFLQFSSAQSAPNLVLGNRNLSLAALAPQIVVVEQVSVITPPTAGSPDAGTRNPLTPISKPYLDLVHNSKTDLGLPTYFCMLDMGSLIVGPWPDAAYPVEVFGTYRPAPIGAADPNKTTWICDNLPEVFVTACMVRLSGWRRDFNSVSSDDPRAAGYWEDQFEKLIQALDIEEAQKSFQASSWSSQKPTAAATPPRK